VKDRYLINQNGSAIVIVFLILLPLLVITNIYTSENKQMLTGGNINLKNTIVTAAKAAAQSVESTSQAYGKPMIDPNTAHNNFRKLLAKNLKLDEYFLPTTGSSFEGDISYYLLICNGTNTFGLDECIIYKYEDGEIETVVLNTGELPQTFGINKDFNITSKDKSVTLKTPGVIAIVKAKIKPIAMTSGVETTRWASARIIGPKEGG